MPWASVALVLAYVMIWSLAEDIIAVLNRDIGPNSGFLEQLSQLELSLSPQSSQVTEEDHTHSHVITMDTCPFTFN